MRTRIAQTWQLLSVGWRIDRRLMIDLVAAMTVSNLAVAAEALWLGLMVDAVSDQRQSSAIAWAVAIAVTDGLRSVAVLRTEIGRIDLQDRATQYFQSEAMRLAGEAEHLDVVESPDHLDRLMEFRSTLPSLGDGMAAVMNSVAIAVRAIVIGVLLAAIDIRLLLLPLFVLPSVWSGRRSQQRSIGAQPSIAENERTAAELHDLLVRPAPASEVKVLGLGSLLTEQADVAWARVSRARVRDLVGCELIKFGGWAAFVVGYIGAVLIVIDQLASGRASVADVLVVILVSTQIGSTVVELSTLSATVAQAAHGAALYRSLGTPSVGNEPKKAPPDRLASGIRLRGVKFAYPGQATPVISGFDLDLQAGSTVAIVGENGAGKSTLVKLLCGLYEPDSGSIEIDGQDLASTDTSAWHARVSATFQSPQRFELVVRQAIGVGHLARVDDEGLVRAAAERAGAAALLDGLPTGLTTPLGSSFVDGTQLSGGQWQRIGVARGFMRPAPLLLVLDEPTSATDPIAERDLFERYAAAAGASGAITLLISHRFSSVQIADHIVVLGDGGVVEQGTHDELVRVGGLYAELHEMQAGSYR